MYLAYFVEATAQPFTTMDLMMRDLLGEELEPKVLTRLRKQLKQATNMIQSSHQS